MTPSLPISTAKQNETSLVYALKDLFQVLGIPCYHNIQGYHSRGHARGRPDLEAIWKGVTYFIECKHPKTGGKMSSYQEEHRQMIETAGAPYIKATSVDDVVKGMRLPVGVRG